MTAAVYIAAGLGDAVLLSPAIRELKKKYKRVVGVFSRCSPGCVELFNSIGFLDETVILKTTSDYLLFSLKNLGRFESSYLNYLCGGKWNYLAASFTSKKVISLSSPKKLLKSFPGKYRFVIPKSGIHDTIQNLRMVGNENKCFQYVCERGDYRNSFSRFEGLLKTPFITVQLSAGNNVVRYKNWPEEHWSAWLKRACSAYRDVQFVLLGDTNEKKIAERVMESAGKNILSLVGETSIPEAMALLEKSLCFVGLDGGLMHLAALVNCPTFTLWGPSSQVLYGYQQFSSRHHAVSLKLPCGPCNAWIEPNRTRVDDPNRCPDYRCMKQLFPDIVFEKFQAYVKNEKIL